MTEAYARTNRIEDVAVYPIIDLHDYVDTGFYLIPKADFREAAVKLGRWDAATGQVVMDEPGTVRPTPAETPDTPTGKSSRRRRFDPFTDHRRHQVIAAYNQGRTIDRIGTLCHMHEDTAKAILRAAGVYQERGLDAHRHQTVKGGKLTTAKVEEILASQESNAVLAARYKIGKRQIGNIRNGKAWLNVGRQNPA